MVYVDKLNPMNIYTCTVIVPRSVHWPPQVLSLLRICIFFLYLEHKEVLILLVSVSLHVVHLFLPFCVGLSEMTVCE